MNLKPELSAGEPNGSILFVDDEPLSLKYFKSSVGRYAKVLTASSPDAALKILASEGNTISVVVSDERMPHESGVAFLSSVRKSFPSTIRVLTSAYANIENLQEAINGAGIFRFVPKPWDLDELCSVMQKALHAERAAEALTEPLLGPYDRGDAENANLELLAILARELAQPLEALDAKAFQLAVLTGSRSVAAPQSLRAHMENWSAQLSSGQIAACTTQMQHDVEQCRSLAASIAALAASLCDAAAAPTESMAETIAEVLDQIGPLQRQGLTIGLDAEQNFPYRAPKQIMMLVLRNLLRGITQAIPNSDQSAVTVRLVPGCDHNEVRITSDVNLEFLLSGSTARANRCALWAFGGELALSSDRLQGANIASVRLPRAQTAADASPCHSQYQLTT